MVGGMEKVSFSLAQELSKKTNLTVLSWGKSQKYLPFVLPYFLFKAAYIISTKKIDHVHLGDALLSPLGLVLKRTFNIRTSVTVHGLDITFKFRPYQFIVPRCLSLMDSVICISNATLEECKKRGVPTKKCTIIPWGVDSIEYRMNFTRIDLESFLKANIRNKKVIITVGRLVERKGVYWFIKSVFPKLSSNFIYLVVGTGEEYANIKNLINDLNLNNRVFMLGRVSDSNLKLIYNTSDIFIMPNIKVKDDIEGFGIVAIEASSAGLPVIASKLEGITEAVIPFKNGLLVNPEQKEEFVNAISNLKMDKKKIADFTKENFSWPVIGQRYINIFR